MFIKRQFPLTGISLQIYLTLSVSLNTVSTGLTASWTSQELYSVDEGNENEENANIQMNLITSLPLLGALLSLPFLSYLMDRFGRKWTCIFGSLLQSIVWIMLIFSWNSVCLYMGLFLRGFTGLIFLWIGAIYLAEITKPEIRGAATCCIAMFRCLGMWLSFVMVMFVSENVVASIGGIISVVAFLLFLPAPETPYHLILKGDLSKARKSLERLRGNMDVDEELEDVKITAEQKENTTESLGGLFRSKSGLKATLLALGVMCVQVFTGIEAVESYIIVIFSSTHKTISDNASSLIFVTIKMVACGVGLSLIDRVGRRPLIIYSTYIIAFALFGSGLYFFLQDKMFLPLTSNSWALNVLLNISVVSYNVGLGTVITSFTTELLPTRFRTISSITVLLFADIQLIIVMFLFSYIKILYGLYLVFWMYTISSALGGLFCIAFVCETKGKSLKDIQVGFK